MNPKTRVLKSLNHETPDRCPINFRGTDAVIELMCSHYRANYSELLEHLSVDFREVIPDYIGPPFKQLDDGSVFDIWGVSRREIITQYSRDVYINYNPLSNANSVEEIINYKWPSMELFDFSQIEAMCDKYKGYAISTPGIHVEGHHGVFHLLTYLFGMEKAMLNMVTDEAIILEAINQIIKCITEYYDQLLTYGKGKIDFLFYKDDFGAQNNLMISRDMFLKYFAPGIKSLVELADSYGVALILHSCGSVIKLIPDFIDLGVRVLDPIQTSAKDMDIDILKKQFGDKLTFHGGIDTQFALPKSSSSEIRNLVSHTIELLGSGGGYFLCPSHRIQQDTPVENIVAMYETAIAHKY